MAIRIARRPARAASHRVLGVGVKLLAGFCWLLVTQPLLWADNQFVVNSLADDGSPGTLRWAITEATAAGAGTQTIDFQLPSNATITLTADLPMLDNSSGTIVIQNTGSEPVTISGNQAHSVFFVAAGTVSISNLAIEDGLAQGGSGGDGNGGGGGGLGAGGALFVNDGASVSIQNVSFNGNSATGGTGGQATTQAGGGGGGGLGAAGGSGGTTSAFNGGGGGGGGGFAGNGGDGHLGGGGGGGVLGSGGAGDRGGGGGGGLTAGSAATDNGGNGDSGALGGDAGTSSNSSAPAGNGGDGQSPLTGGGGGGGAGGDNTGSGPAGNGGMGGDGGIGGGGGGGGAGGAATSGTQGDGGHGGAGGLYGGGGGAGSSHGGDQNGGDGGDFGGGGGAGVVDWEHHYSPSGGNGGFGAGGGGASAANNSSGGTAGFGGGNGSTRFRGGDGGSAYGGAIFVREGGSLTILGGVTSGNTVTAGAGGGSGTGGGNGHAGQTDGQDLYLMSGVNASLSESTLSGTISGQGGITVQGNGATVLTGANNYTGSTSVSGNASLQGTTSSLQGSIDSSANVTFTQSFDGTYSGNMTGNGTITKNGTGIVTFTGTMAATSTDLQSGGLAVNGSLSSDVTVGAGTTLGGTGSIQGAVVVDGNTAPGNSIGTLTVEGPYIQNAGSTLTIEAVSGGSTPGVHNDLLIVDSGILSGGEVLIDAAPGTYNSSIRGFLRSETSFQGTFDSITSNLSDYQVLLDYGYAGGYYWAAFVLQPLSPDYVQFATTSNQQAVAGYLDSIYDIPDPALEEMFINLNLHYDDPAAMQSSFNQISGQVSPTMAYVGLQSTTLVVQQLAGQLRAGSFLSGGNTVGSGASLNAAKSTTMLVSYDRSAGRPIVTFVSEEDCNCWQGWSFGYGLGGSAKSDGNAAGLNYGMGGMLLGAEHYFDRGGRLGMFGGYQGTNLQLDGLPQNGRINGGMFGGYLHNDDGFAYYTAITGMQFNGYETTRHIPFDGAIASGNFSGWQGYGYYERGATLRHAGMSLQPFAALQYIYLRQNNYTETGAGVLNLDVSGIDAHSLRSLVGTRLQYDRGWYGGRLLPELRALWLHEFLDTDAVVNSFFAPIGGGSFAIQGLNLGRDWAIVGGGLRYELASGWQLYGNYDAQVNSQLVFHVGSGGLTYAW